MTRRVVAVSHSMYAAIRISEPQPPWNNHVTLLLCPSGLADGHWRRFLTLEVGTLRGQWAAHTAHNGPAVAAALPDLNTCQSSEHKNSDSDCTCSSTSLLYLQGSPLKKTFLGPQTCWNNLRFSQNVQKQMKYFKIKYLRLNFFALASGWAVYSQVKSFCSLEYVHAQSL